MWWLISLAIGGAAYLIQQTLKGKAQAEYERWGNNHQRLQDRIRWHRQAVAQHLKSAQQRSDFRLLCQLHFDSHKLANEAYRLLRDAKVAETEIRKALGDIKSKMESIYRQTKAPGSGNAEREELHSQLADLKRLKEALVADVRTKAKEVIHFREEVRQLNRETHKVKHAIPDRCGRRGIKWYNQLEARTRARSVLRAS